MVAVAGTLSAPWVLERRRITIADPQLPGSTQPYHAAAELPFSLAEANRRAHWRWRRFQQPSMPSGRRGTRCSIRRRGRCWLCRRNSFRLYLWMRSVRWVEGSGRRGLGRADGAGTGGRRIPRAEVDGAIGLWLSLRVCSTAGLEPAPRGDCLDSHPVERLIYFRYLSNQFISSKSTCSMVSFPR